MEKSRYVINRERKERVGEGRGEGREGLCNAEGRWRSITTHSSVQGILINGGGR